MKISLCIPDITDEEIAKATEVIKSGWLTHGPKNKELEKNFSEYIGVKHSLAMNSCTSALFLSILGQDIKGEVILPSFTFVASANAIVTAGAKPVFAEIDYDTCNISPESIEDKVTEKTEAIMPVHYAGQSCDMDPIIKIAKRHNLKIIEDSAETIGGEYKGKKTGNFGTACFSFFPTKNITTGEGGMLTTNNDELAAKAKTLMAHGISSSTFEREKQERPWLRAATLPGYNFRMSNILAAIGVVQLSKLDKMNKLRRDNAKLISESLSRIDGIETPTEKEHCKHVYQMYTIKLSKSINRTEFIKSLREKGIEASVHFDPPVHLHPYYMKFGNREGNLPITEDVSQRIVTLPMFPTLTREQIDYMIKIIGSITKKI